MDIILPYKRVISLLEEIPTDGNSPIKVITDDYQTYVAKNSKSKNPATDIINELICNLLMQIWKIPVAECALLKIDPSQISDQYSVNHKPRYYEKPVFGSKWIQEAIDVNEFLTSNDRNGLRLITNPMDLFKIGLFDIWIENDDRKGTNYNLLLNPKEQGLEITAIDHSFVFSTMNYKDLNPNDFSPIYNDNLLVSDFAKALRRYKKSNRENIEIDQKIFYFCVKECEQHFLEIIKQIPFEWGFSESDSDQLSSFLFDEKRNSQVFYDYVSKLS